ncbi:MAG: 6-carboxytetrahydropterin synthase QueD [Ignavibacteria bacterium]|nr:6-carboxytetrahydropterin synthase QueD [Ignavibacteria bacterium]MDP3830906.1 6-carboxytetrahydropterin synthase QueD [Ignavibacteriaceae bacterium]
MKIAKEFRWEMGHRLPFHKGKCVNLHGHSYKMLVEVEGDLDENGMVIDYYDLKAIINPVVEDLDHAYLVWKGDTELISMLDQLKSKKVVIDTHSTAENMCLYFLDKIRGAKLPENVKSIKVRIYETIDDYAEETIILK